MIDFGLGRCQLELAGMACVAALLAMPVLRLVFGGAARRIRRLPLPTAVVLALCMAKSVIVGGAKTNGYLPPSKAAQPPGSPAQTAQGARTARNWNVRGAFDDSFWLDFEGGFVFPDGTNHLSGVEVLASGEVWRSPFDADAIASLGVPVAIVPGLSGFAHEYTPSNSYRFVWTDCAANRSTNDLVSAAIELFRNGDVSVATNGGTAHRPRVLPFAHHGFGQDAEWVTANFTNAEEILAVGYSQWVNAQVGTGLANGLYRLVVSVADDPPETTLLTVGDLSVVVTNAGEYAFLLWKCIDYPITVFPATATNFTYSAVDDIAPRPALLGRRAVNDGRWTADEGSLELVIPYGIGFPGVPAAHICWKSRLAVSPATWQPSELCDTETFEAVLTDVPWWKAPSSYRWSTSNPDVVSISSPGATTTQMTARYPAADEEQVSLSLEVRLGDCTLRSYYAHDPGGDGNGGGVSLTVSAPDVLFVNDDDDDGGGDVDCMAGATFPEDDDIATGGILLRSPVPTNGTVVVEGVYGYDEGFAELPLVYADPGCTDAVEAGRTFAVSDATEWSQPLYFNPATASTSHPGVQVKARWRPEAGGELTASAFLTVVAPVAEPVCNATTNVVEGGVEHVYAVNPSGVAVGRDAYFRVAVSPADFPDERIVWEATDGLTFAGGNTGRQVTVRGVAAGHDETLTVRIGGREDGAPEFTVRVVEPATVNLRAWIISGPKQDLAYQPEAVRRMVKDASDLYAQVGVTLNLVEPIVVTNIPDAYDALFETPTNATTRWTFDQITDIASGTGGLECYFINRFVDKDDVMAANSSHGIVMTASATRATLAHEIGHAFGMCDIYITNGGSSDSEDSGAPLVELRDTEQAAWARMFEDWNGGCHGQGAGGTRYYRPGTSMREIIGRMLMLGLVGETDERQDITSGWVYGVFYDYQNDEKVWHKALAPVAFPWNFRNPTHQ